ncbi:MAG: SOS response-associated peptidase [Bacillota bacterium]
MIKICGRYFLKMDAKLMAQLFNAILAEEPFSYNQEIYPSEKAPVIIYNPEEADRKIGLMHWGFKTNYSSKLLINARSETIDQKPTFKESFYKRRLLVPFTDYFEWKGPKGNKTKYRFSVKDHDKHAFAGIYNKFKLDNQEHWRFSLITTEPNQKAAEIHNRMPAILTGKNLKTWLDPEADIANLKEILQPYPGQLKYQAEGPQQLSF